MFNFWKTQRDMYPYDFHTCGYEIIDKVRAGLGDRSSWDIAEDCRATLVYCKERAALFGVLEPYNEEQSVLTNYLVSHRAGPKIITDAWSLYANFHLRILHSGEPKPRHINFKNS